MAAQRKPRATTPRVTKPRAPAAPKVNPFQSASRGTLGRDLRRASPAQLQQIATRSGVAIGEGATVAQLRKAVAAQAYNAVAVSRQASGYAPGGAAKAAATLSAVRAAPVAASATTVATVGKAGLDAAREIATGYVTGGKLGAVQAVAKQVGSKKGKIGMAVAIGGYTTYEATQGYKQDGVKGAVFGAADGVVNAYNIVAPGFLSLPDHVVSKIAGYDYGKARKEAEAEAAKAKEGESPAAGETEITIPKLASGFNPFVSKPKPKHEPTLLRDANGDIRAPVQAVGGLAVGVGGMALGEGAVRMRAAAKTAAMAQSLALKAASVPVTLAGKGLLAAGAVAGGVGLLRMLSGAAVAAPGDGAFLNASAERRATAAPQRAPLAPIGAQPTAAPDRSSYTTKDGRTVEATESQARAWRGRRND